MAKLAREDAPAAVIPSPRIVHGTGAASAPLELASSDDEAPPRETPAAAGSIVQSSLILVPTRVSRGKRRTPIVLKVRQSKGRVSRIPKKQKKERGSTGNFRAF